LNPFNAFDKLRSVARATSARGNQISGDKRAGLAVFPSAADSASVLWPGSKNAWEGYAIAKNFISGKIIRD
jgi:hypothetical protein